MGNQARLWERETGEVVERFQGHTGEIRSVAFSADGQRAVTTALDKTVRVWSLLPDRSPAEALPIASTGER